MNWTFMSGSGDTLNEPCAQVDALERYVMLKCEGSRPPTLDKAECPDDDEAMNDDSEKNND